MCRILAVVCKCHNDTLAKEFELCELGKNNTVCLDLHKVNPYSQGSSLFAYSNTIVTKVDSQYSLLLDSIVKVDNVYVDCNLISRSILNKVNSPRELVNVYNNNVRKARALMDSSDNNTNISTSTLRRNVLRLKDKDIDPSDSMSQVSSKHSATSSWVDGDSVVSFKDIVISDVKPRKSRKDSTVSTSTRKSTKPGSTSIINV